ncbi:MULTISPECIES: hypothetical protein [unclassified Rickettsia]|uniref:hypothetical protein n=1 Tax=unclassified Rickettsia TaxID=114295 RepID=UPI0031330A89
MSFPRRQESSRIYVMLNLFQHLLVDPEKIQDDLKSIFLDSRFHGNDIKNSSHATTPKAMLAWIPESSLRGGT